MKTIEKILLEYYSKESHVKHLRFGQWFCNHYIAEPWPELFYQTDIAKAIATINMWCIDNGCVNKMPKKTQEIL